MQRPIDMCAEKSESAQSRGVNYVDRYSVPSAEERDPCVVVHIHRRSDKDCVDDATDFFPAKRKDVLTGEGSW